MSLPDHPTKDRYAVKEDTTVIPFRHSDTVDDPLTEIAREGRGRFCDDVPDLAFAL